MTGRAKGLLRRWQWQASKRDLVLSRRRSSDDSRSAVTPQVILVGITTKGFAFACCHHDGPSQRTCAEQSFGRAAFHSEPRIRSMDDEMTPPEQSP